MWVGEVVNVAIPSPAWTAPQPCPLLQICYFTTTSGHFPIWTRSFLKTQALLLFKCAIT